MGVTITMKRSLTQGTSELPNAVRRRVEDRQEYHPQSKTRGENVTGGFQNRFNPYGSAASYFKSSVDYPHNISSYQNVAYPPLSTYSTALTTSNNTLLTGYPRTGSGAGNSRNITYPQTTYPSLSTYSTALTTSNNTLLTGYPRTGSGAGNSRNITYPQTTYPSLSTYSTALTTSNNTLLTGYPKTGSGAGNSRNITYPQTTYPSLSTYSTALTTSNNTLLTGYPRTGSGAGNSRNITYPQTTYPSLSTYSTALTTSNNTLLTGYPRTGSGAGNSRNITYPQTTYPSLSTYSTALTTSNNTLLTGYPKTGSGAGNSWNITYPQTTYPSLSTYSTTSNNTPVTRYPKTGSGAGNSQNIAYPQSLVSSNSTITGYPSSITMPSGGGTKDSQNVVYQYGTPSGNTVPVSSNSTNVTGYSYVMATQTGDGSQNVVYQYITPGDSSTQVGTDGTCLIAMQTGDGSSNSDNVVYQYIPPGDSSAQVGTDGTCLIAMQTGDGSSNSDNVVYQYITPGDSSAQIGTDGTCLIAMQTGDGSTYQYIPAVLAGDINAPVGSDDSGSYIILMQTEDEAGNSQYSSIPVQAGLTVESPGTSRTAVVPTAKKSGKKSVGLGKKTRTEREKPISTAKHPVQEISQSYPHVSFKEISNTAPFSCEVEVWGWKFLADNKKAKKDAKKAVAEKAILELRHCLAEVTHQDFCDSIEKAVEEKYSSLAKGPLEHLASMRKALSAIVMETNKQGVKTVTIVAMGTGTKTIVSQNMKVGSCLNDCHGEVITRRAFQRYLYYQLQIFRRNPDESVFRRSGRFERKISLKLGITFHMYVSNAPCGDIREFSPKGLGIAVKDEHKGRANRGQARCKLDGGEGSVLSKGYEDGHRVVSMSCSDKMAAWNVLGLQGSLLSLYIEPIYLASVIIGKMYNYDHLSRGIYARVKGISQQSGIPHPFKVNQPLIGEAKTSSYEEVRRSSSNSLNWWLNTNEEIVDTSTGRVSASVPSRLSKQAMFEQFLLLWDHCASKSVKTLLWQEHKIHSNVSEMIRLCRYGDIKKLATDYRKVKDALRQHYRQHLGPWISRGLELNDFKMSKD